MFSSFLSWFSSFFGGKPIPPNPTPVSVPSQPRAIEINEKPVLISFSSNTNGTNKVTLYEDIEFKVETSPASHYDNIEVNLESARNIKIVKPFDKMTGTIVIRFNKRSRNRTEVQTLVATDGDTTLKLPITVSLMQLFWKNHSGRENICDADRFNNQCAIRMGAALELSDIRLSSSRKVLRRCSTEYNTYKDHKTGIIKGHVLAAQELANWLKTQKRIFGKRQIFSSKAEVIGRTGVIFFRDGWGTTDHIDVWNGKSLVGGFDNYFDSDFKELWFWDVY